MTTCMDFVIAGLSSMTATVFSNPFDVVKTRMQLQGELKPLGQYKVIYKLPHQAAYTIVRKEGFFALQKGLSAALLMHGISNSIKLGSYQWLTEQGYITNKENQIIVHRSLLAAALGGGLGAFVSSPLYKISTQFQAQAVTDTAVGYQHQHSNVVHALKTIFQKHKVKGLWKGATANIIRTMIGSSVQLTTFTKAKEVSKSFPFEYTGSSVFSLMFASVIAAVCQSVVQTPFDLVSVRLNNQAVDCSGKGTLYRGVVHCFYQTWKCEGFRAFYKGTVVNYMQIVRHTAVCLIVWEILKDLLK